MLEILICTHDPMLLKGLCNPLKDAGYSVSTADHTAQAVRMMLKRPFGAVIYDSDVIGLSAAEALPVIRHVAPCAKVIVIGDSPCGADVWMVSRPTGLDEVRALVVSICGSQLNNPAKERV